MSGELTCCQRKTKISITETMLCFYKIWAVGLLLQPWAGSSDIFYFCPSSKGRGWGGSEGRGNFSKIRGKRGKKKGGGGEEGSMQEKGRGHFWGGGVLNIYFEG